jgi:FtsX-like permease family
MAEAHVRIGDLVTVQADLADRPPRPVRMRVVGRAIIPPAPFAATRPGEGAFVTARGAARFDPSLTQGLASGNLPFLVRFDPNVDEQAALLRLQARLPAGVQFYPSWRGDQATLGRIAQVPLVLALLLALIALGTLAQTLVTSVRARRRDLAILKTLGLSRRQVRAAVAWQASVMVAIAVVVGVPVGIAVGRWVWRSLADGISVFPQPTVSVVAIAVGVCATILVANLIAAVPARSAARTKPAVVLRSE